MCARADIPHLRSKMFNYPSGLASRIPCLLDVAASKLLFDAVMSVGQKTLEALQVPPRIRDSLATNSALPLLALAFALQAPRICQSRCPRPHRAMLRTESLGRLSRRASSFYITEERLPPPPVSISFSLRLAFVLATLLLHFAGWELFVLPNVPTHTPDLLAGSDKCTSTGD